MKFAVAHDSRIGRRGMNQDRLDWAETPEAAILVLADGMGGHRHGEVAAQIAVRHITDAFRQEATPRLDDPLRFLADAITRAHHEINSHAAMRAIPIDDAPRTTCVACVVQDGHAIWAHAGDSRLYHIRSGVTLSRTIDHSRVQMLIDAGEITLAQAQTHPQRNLVYNCLGGDMRPRVDISPAVLLMPGDVLALCSDGAWGPTAERLPAAFALPLERAVPFLLNAAETGGGANCDNLSLLALRWDGDGDTVTEDYTLSLPAVSTMVQNFADPSDESAAAILTDAEIERAVAEIRSRIQTQKTNGANS